MLKYTISFFIIYSECNELCWTCEDSSNEKCSSCSDKGYREFGTKCVATCPFGYKSNDYLRSCEPDSPSFSIDLLSSLNKGIYEIDKIDISSENSINGCLIGEYFNATT